MAILGGADDGHGAFGERPSDTNLRAREAVFRTDFLHGIREGGQLAKDWIVFLPTVTVSGERILHVILAGKRSLLEHHVGPELDPVLYAVVQHAAFLGGTVEQAEMVLNGAHLESRFAKDLISPAYLFDIMVGNSDLANFA